MPTATSPQGKAESKAAGKPAAKPPPKGITPLSGRVAAKPPPKTVTSKAQQSKEDKAWEDWEKAKATVAERQHQENMAAPKSPPLFAVDWSRLTSREGFLHKTAEVYRLDPNSAEGYSHHVASHYYVSTDWGVSHPQSYSSIMLKNDSKQSHRWTRVHCRPSHPEIADHKAVEEGMIHWWRNHCHPASWVWCEKATAFNVTTAEVCKAVLSIDLSDQPLPLGGAFHMLPNALPSHPKGLGKRLFKPPYSKTLTPAHHPSEQGLPWNAHLEQLAREPDVELTSWGWEQFFGSVLEGNSDVLSFLIHPCSSLNEYVNSRKAWHNKAITSPGAKEMMGHLIDVEQHAFMLVLLKVLVTKGESMLMPSTQVDQVKRFLQKYEAVFPEKAQEVLNQVRLGGSDRDYVGSVKEYALAAHNLITPVNIWRIPYPRGHAAVFASPTKLSLVAANQ